MKTLAIVNCGGGSAGDDAEDRVRAALAAAGVEAEVRSVDGPDLADEATAAAKAGAALVIAAGGDGTMSAVAGALAGTKTRMGILPMGTLNHLARDLGIPFDLDEAAKALAAGQSRAIDIATLNGRPFVNNSAIGLYPLMVVDRDSQQSRLGRSKRLAMVVASVRTLLRFHDQRLTLTVNDAKEGQLDTPLLFVGNNDYSLALPAAGQRQALDDGRLCVMVMRKKGVPGLIAATLRALLGLTKSDDMIKLDDVQRLRVAARRSRLTVSLDGETLSLETPLDYRIRPGALTVIAPAA